ncbi:MAG: hypothetical protein K5647_10575 [Clostridiales bacterium]|nr:hypothetical protein [Clostridiales bacterium]
MKMKRYSLESAREELAANRVAPSLIRTDADELTYCLHVMVRYELEKRMFDGEITASDLPSEWDRLFREYLGIEVPDARLFSPSELFERVLGAPFDPGYYVDYLKKKYSSVYRLG